MAIAVDAKTGATGTGTGESAALNHAANVLIIISITNDSTTSPNSVQVGGVNATYYTNSKQSGTLMSTEIWYIWRAAAANENVTVGWAASHRHAWNAVSYTGSYSGAVESITGTSGAGASVRTASIAVGAGTANRVVISGTGSRDAAKGSGSIAIAPAGSPAETEEREDELAGGTPTGAWSVGSQIQSYAAGASARTMVATHTKAGSTLNWAIAGFAIKPSVPVTLTVNDAYCTSQVDAFVAKLVIQHVIHGLADAFCTSQTDGSPTVKLVQVHNLVVPTDPYCTSQSDKAAVTKQSALIVNDSYCVSQVDIFTTTKPYALVVPDAYCISQVDAVVIEIQATQFLYPSADVTDGNWTNESGNNTNLYDSVNEHDNPSDSDYIQSELDPYSSPVVIKLESGIDPVSSTGHVLRYRVTRYPADSGILDVTVQIRQGYVSESSLGTLIAEWVEESISDDLTTIERTLTSGQADSITDYSDLYVRIIANDVIFKDDFSSGDFTAWSATQSAGSGTATVTGGYARFYCPNGNNNGSPPPEDEAVARLDLSGAHAWPSGGVLWMKCKMKFVSANTQIAIGGGFFMELTSGTEIGANYVNRWNIEFYSASQENDDPSPYNGELPIKVCGTADAGTPRIHSTNHDWISPDTWYEIWLKVDYSGTNPSATWYLNGVQRDTLVDTTILSVNATKPSYFRIGQPWFDECTKMEVHINDVVLQDHAFSF